MKPPKIDKTARSHWRKGIDAFCKQCIFDPFAGVGSWRDQVEACTSWNSCPLWHLRPLTEKTTKAIADPKKAEQGRKTGFQSGALNE